MGLPEDPAAPVACSLAEPSVAIGLAELARLASGTEGVEVAWLCDPSHRPLRVFSRPVPPVDGETPPAIVVMLDVSRDRIPTMEEFGRIVPWLASLKVNHLQLYTEHTFAYAGHEEVWRGWSPLTPAEIREIDALCIGHGIELAANQNCFGHLRTWLELPRYAHLAETHGDWVFDVWAVHLYPKGGTLAELWSGPEGYLARLTDVADTVAPGRQPGDQLWITEINANVAILAAPVQVLTDQDQAAFVQLVAHDTAARGIPIVVWYRWHYDPWQLGSGQIVFSPDSPALAAWGS